MLPNAIVDFVDVGWFNGDGEVEGLRSGQRLGGFQPTYHETMHSHILEPGLEILVDEACTAVANHERPKEAVSLIGSAKGCVSPTFDLHLQATFLANKS